MSSLVQTSARAEPKDGEAFLPAGFFDSFPQLELERNRFASPLERSGTPVFLADERIVTDRHERLEHALRTQWGSSAIAYSFKTNYAVAESGILQRRGAWAEVVSGREYALARRLGYSGAHIVFNGPLKRDAELRATLADGALVHVDNEEELERVLMLAARRPARARTGLRVRADLESLPSRFGFSLNDEAQAAAAAVASVPGVALESLHLHLKGDTDDPAVYRAAARQLAGFLRNLPDDVRRRLRSLDFGGGFPAHGPKPRSRQSWEPRPVEEYVAAIVEELAPVFPAGERPMLILEPGRYLVADAFSFVSRVLRAGRSVEGELVTVDGAATMLPLRHYCPQVARVFAADLTARYGEPVHSVVFGSSCRENDVLYEGLLPRTHPGDLIAFYATGAYNASLSPAFIFEVPPTVLVP